mgnify:CR=1 FL=1
MYSSVGIGAPYGAFEIVGPSGVERRIDLVDAMGLDSIQSIQRYTGSGSLKADFHAETALEATARSICAELRQDQSLRFIGRLAARGGWLRIRKDHAELCEMD